MKTLSIKINLRFGFNVQALLKADFPTAMQRGVLITSFNRGGVKSVRQDASVSDWTDICINPKSWDQSKVINFKL